MCRGFLISGVFWRREKVFLRAMEGEISIDIFFKK